MASAPLEPPRAHGRVDRSGRLIAADDRLAILQREAGAEVGDLLAIPQIAAVARLAASLNVAVERPAIAASQAEDFELVVQAVPEGDEIALIIDGWIARPAGGSRLSALDASNGSESQAESVAQHQWAVDSQMRITALSAGFEKSLGLQSGECSGLDLTRVFQLIESDSGNLPLMTALVAGGDFSLQMARVRSNPERTLQLDGTVSRSADGSFAGIEGEARLSGTPQLPPDEPQTGTLDRTLDAMLRSPLDRIIAEAEQIVGGDDGPLRSDYASYGNDIAAAARHLLSVIGAMGDANEIGVDAIDLTALAAEAVMLVEPAAEERWVTLEIEGRGSLPAIGEERSVIQVLVNLVDNALRHSKPGSAVRLTFSDDVDFASVTVADEGVGIDPADHQRIFEKFERGDETPGGSGLGLAIARRLARSMGGDITLESALGQGARFTLSLRIR